MWQSQIRTQTTLQHKSSKDVTLPFSLKNRHRHREPSSYIRRVSYVSSIEVPGLQPRQSTTETHLLYMMPDKDIPADAPPSYSDATGAAPSSSRLTRSNTGNTDNEGHLKVPGSSKSHSIPPEHRRSMEDERRPLPDGWVRSFDPATHHQFFVDTTKEPPRSIWVHPYDDEEYLSTLTSEQRERKSNLERAVTASVVLTDGFQILNRNPLAEVIPPARRT